MKQIVTTLYTFDELPQDAKQKALNENYQINTEHPYYWKERLDELQDPELTIDRALAQYLQLGYSENWINQRLKSIEIRKELTDEWKSKGLKEGAQFAILTDIITKAWSEKTTKEYNPDSYRDKRVEKRKSSGQYDKYGINFEYVG